MSKPTLHVLPIEPFDERYTGQWFDWWPSELRAAGLAVNVHSGFGYDGASEFSRDGGEFLDPIKTWLWKGRQVAELAEEWQQGRVIDGDVILTLDGWGPASTAAAYMRDTTKVDVKIVAFWHAGAYDPHDFLARTCSKWALCVERGWHRSADMLLVGSEFHASMIRRHAGQDHLSLPPIAATGYPIHRAAIMERAGRVEPFEQRERLVVFPHRLAPEKQPELFEELRETHARLYPGPGTPETTWVRTRDFANTKDDYYALLARARVVVSFAKQETFGIAMQEGIALGAWPIVPHRLSYPEVVQQALGEGGSFWPQRFGYQGEFDTIDDAAHMVERYLNYDEGPTWSGYHERAIERAAEAIRELTS